MISDDKVWMKLLEDRNLTSHIYNENLANEVAKRIVGYYVAAICELLDNLEELLQLTFKNIKNIMNKTNI